MRASDPAPYFHLWLTRARERAGLTPEDFANACGVDVRTIARSETGQTAPRPRLCLAMARVLRIPVSVVLALAGCFKEDDLLGIFLALDENNNRNKLEHRYFYEIHMAYRVARERVIRTTLAVERLCALSASVSVPDMERTAREKLGLHPDDPWPVLSEIKKDWLEITCNTLKTDTLLTAGLEVRDNDHHDHKYEKEVQDNGYHDYKVEARKVWLEIARLSNPDWLAWSLATGWHPDEMFIILGSFPPKLLEEAELGVQGLIWRTASKRVVNQVQRSIQQETHPSFKAPNGLWAIYQEYSKELGATVVALSPSLPGIDGTRAEVGVPRNSTEHREVLTKPALSCGDDGTWTLRIPPCVSANDVLHLLWQAESFCRKKS